MGISLRFLYLGTLKNYSPSLSLPHDLQRGTSSFQKAQTYEAIRTRLNDSGVGFPSVYAIHIRQAGLIPPVNRRYRDNEHEKVVLRRIPCKQIGLGKTKCPDCDNASDDTPFEKLLLAKFPEYCTMHRRCALVQDDLSCVMDGDDLLSRRFH
jgi:hypothetical protein